VNHAVAESPERGGDERVALFIATKFPHVLYDDCDMASLSRHSAKLSASLPCEGIGFRQRLRETTLTETFLLLQCFVAVG